MLILNIETLDLVKSELRRYLSDINYEVMIEFKKTDDTIRVMNCTTAPEILKRYIELNETIPDCTESPKEIKHKSDHIQCVFDIDKKSWRSFKWDNLIEVHVKESKTKE